MKLTKREIDLLTCPPSRRDMLVFDEDLTGFGLRVTAAGTKLFLFQYRRGKAVHRVQLGRYGEITPAKARKLAERCRGDVAAGKSPVAERAAVVAAEAAEMAFRRKQAAEDAFTLAALITAWEQIGLKESRAAHRKEGPAAMRRGLASFLKRPAHAVSAFEAQQRIDVLAAKTPAMARRTRDYARAAYNWGMARHLLSANPFAKIVMEAREVERQRMLSDAELGAAWRSASETAYPFGPLMQLLILTLQRRGEVAGMRWSELSPDLSTWTIPAARTKNRKSHIVHLSEPARLALVQVPRVSGQDLLFTTTGTRPVSGFTHAAEALRRKASRQEDDPKGKPGKKSRRKAADQPNPPDWRLHDFRRTGTTVLAQLGVDPFVADRILNHVSGKMRGVMAVYQKHDFSAERVVALDQWAAHVVKVGVELPAPSNVVQIAAAKKLGRQRDAS